MKTLIVTGCAGFIASNFCQLFEKEFDIIGIDCFRRGSHPQNVSPNIRFHSIDISSEAVVSELSDTLDRIDGIINFAAESHVDHALADDTLFWSTNVGGARNLAKIALQRNIRLLQVSTDEVYGPSEKGEAFSEEVPCRPKNPYAASKAAADLLLKSYHHSYGLDCVITRGTNTIGPRQSFDKVVPKAVHCFLTDRPFPLFRTPARRMWLGVEDHCRAILEAFLNGVPGSVYNVSPDAGNEMETKTLVERIRDMLGKGEIQLVEDRSSYDLRYLLSSQKLRSELDWKPRQLILELLKATVDWYRRNPEWIRTHPDLSIT